jgi:hypothetical protein
VSDLPLSVGLLLHDAIGYYEDKTTKGTMVWQKMISHRLDFIGCWWTARHCLPNDHTSLLHLKYRWYTNYIIENL